MRWLTWNVWWRFENWEERQDAIAEVLVAADADVIALQETWPDQVVALAERLGYDSSFTGREPSDRFPISFGNAILSRHPICQRHERILPAIDTPGYRRALHVRIEAAGREIDVFTTHLAYRFDESVLRVSQLEDVIAFVDEYRSRDPSSHPPMLMGDLNAVPDSDEVRRLTGRSAPYRDGLVWTDAWEQVGDGPGWTWCEDNPYVVDSAWPNRRIDYVLIGWPRPRPLGNPQRVAIVGLEPGSGGVFASDHYGVMVTTQS